MPIRVNQQSKWPAALPQIMDRARADGIPGRMPGTLLARNVSLTPEMPLSDVSIKQTTPGEVLRNNAYGELWDEIRKSLTDKKSTPAWAENFPDDKTHIVYGAALGMVPGMPGGSAFAMSGRRTGIPDDHWQKYPGGVMNLPETPGRFYPGHAATVAHEARHFMFPRISEQQSPGTKRLRGTDLAARLLGDFTKGKSREEIMSQEYTDQVEKAVMVALEADHLRQPSEFFAKLGDLKQDFYGRTGKYPMDYQGNEEFIQDIIDSPEPSINRDARWFWELLQDDKPYEHGPMKGTKPVLAPMNRQLFKHDVLPVDDPDRMEFIIRSLQHFAGQPNGAPNAT